MIQQRWVELNESGGEERKVVAVVPVGSGRERRMPVVVRVEGTRTAEREIGTVLMVGLGREVVIVELGWEWN